MKITNHNIEEYIFDYYEGNLGLEDSNTLLNFLNKHKEHEELFNSWSAMYNHETTEPKNYNLEKDLLKTEKYFWRRVLTGATLIGLSSLAIYFLTKNEPKQNDTPKAIEKETTPEHKELKPKVTEPITVEKSHSKPNKERRKPVKTKPTNNPIKNNLKTNPLNEHEQPVSQTPKNSDSLKLDSTILVIPKQEEAELPKITAKVIQEQKTEKKPDSTTQLLIPSVPEEKSKKEKKKVKLTPTDDITPINSDF